MSNQDDASTFVQKAFETIQDATSIGKNDLVIAGGEFAAGQFTSFLKEWSSSLDKLPWRIWVHPSRFALLHKDSEPLPNNGDEVERLHCFGEDGDLMIRRDEDRFYWRFIGMKAVNWPQIEGAEDYWEAHPDGRFLAVEQSYFQCPMCHNELRQIA